MSALSWSGSCARSCPRAEVLVEDPTPAEPTIEAPEAGGEPEYDLSGLGAEFAGGPPIPYDRLEQGGVNTELGLNYCAGDEDFFREMEGSYRHKFAKKPEVIEGNLKALHMAYEEVK